MSRLTRLLAREDGIAMVTVVGMIVLLTVLSVTLLDQVTTESNRASNSVKSDAVFQAAEAGINDYVAKLLDDAQYYDHFVANGESTRTPCTANDASGVCNAWGSPTYAAGSAWPSGTHWGYNPTTNFPNGKDRWYAGTGTSSSNSTLLGTADWATSTLRSGYAYNLMITPPSATLGVNYVTIVSTGCRLVAGTPISNPICDTSTNAPPRRAVEVRIRRMTPADFQFLWPGNVAYGADATTYGKVYSGGTIDHDGYAYGDLLAETSVTGNVNLTSHRPTDANHPIKAKIYTQSTNPSIRTQIKKQIVFNDFVMALKNIKSAAAYSGMSFANSSVGAWRFVFMANGTVQVSQCTRSGSDDVAKTKPTCGAATTYNLPSNGAIYAEQTAIVSWPTSGSTVSGRVTIASNNDIVIGGNIHYQSEYGGPNDDVLGLVANVNVYIAKWAPNALTWRAAAIAQTGTWSSYSCGSLRPAGSSLLYIGATAAKITGCASDFDNRVYASDDGSYNSSYNALKFLIPPWYPPLFDGAETTVLFHEVDSGYVPPVG